MIKAAKPAIGELGSDVGTMAWRHSTAGSGAIEIAFTRIRYQNWALMPLSDDSGGRISVFTRFG